MTLTYNQLTKLNESLDKELTYAYDYCEMVQEMNHELMTRNIQLEVLSADLSKKLKRGLLS